MKRMEDGGWRNDRSGWSSGWNALKRKGKRENRVETALSAFCRIPHLLTSTEEYYYQEAQGKRETEGRE